MHRCTVVGKPGGVSLGLRGVLGVVRKSGGCLIAFLCGSFTKSLQGVHEVPTSPSPVCIYVLKQGVATHFCMSPKFSEISFLMKFHFEPLKIITSSDNDRKQNGGPFLSLFDRLGLEPLQTENKQINLTTIFAVSFTNSLNTC